MRLIENDFGTGAKNEFSAIGHRIAGIGCQVEHRQFQLIDVGQDGFGLRQKAGFDFHRRAKGAA
ncbi:hypothetical protein D3C87_2161520 [compost metagenome]